MRLVLACPYCLRSDGLYEKVSVSGWRDLKPIPVDEQGRAAVDDPKWRWNPNEAFVGRRGEVDWDGVDFESYSCSCADDADLRRSDLVVIDEVGERWEPPPPPHPGQTALID